MVLDSQIYGMACAWLVFLKGLKLQMPLLREDSWDVIVLRRKSLKKDGPIAATKEACKLSAASFYPPLK
jgi:hypothetical protein